MLEVIIKAVQAYLLISGGLFFITTAVFMLRFTNVYARLHVTSKCLAGGSLSMLIAYMIQAGDMLTFLKLALMAFFMLLTSAVASHALARSAYRRGYNLQSLEHDEYKEDLA